MPIQISDDAYAWYLGCLKTVDDRDVENYGDYLADDCVLYLNNKPQLEGKGEILHALANKWMSYTAVTHEIRNIYGNDDAFVAEALNHYERYDGQKVSIRAAVLIDRNNAGLATSLRFYLDLSPLR